MGIDIKRLLVVIISFLLAQILIQNFLILLGFNGIALVILYNLLLSFVAVLIYYPTGYRKEAFKNPDFYRDVAIFFLVFLLLAFI